MFLGLPRTTRPDPVLMEQGRCAGLGTDEMFPDDDPPSWRAVSTGGKWAAQELVDGEWVVRMARVDARWVTPLVEAGKEAVYRQACDRVAATVCTGCPVLARCTEEGADEPFGVWGGLAPHERGFDRTGRRPHHRSRNGQWWDVPHYWDRLVPVIRAELERGEAVATVADRYEVNRARVASVTSSPVPNDQMTLDTDYAWTRNAC